MVPQLWEGSAIELPIVGWCWCLPATGLTNDCWIFNGLVVLQMAEVKGILGGLVFLHLLSLSFFINVDHSELAGELLVLAVEDGLVIGHRFQLEHLLERGPSPGVWVVPVVAIREVRPVVVTGL